MPAFTLSSASAPHPGLVPRPWHLTCGRNGVREALISLARTRYLAHFSTLRLSTYMNTAECGYGAMYGRRRQYAIESLASKKAQTSKDSPRLRSVTTCYTAYFFGVAWEVDWKPAAAGRSRGTWRSEDLMAVHCCASQDWASSVSFSFSFSFPSGSDERWVPLTDRVHGADAVELCDMESLGAGYTPVRKAIASKVPPCLLSRWDLHNRLFTCTLVSRERLRTDRNAKHMITRSLTAFPRSISESDCVVVVGH